MNPQIYGYRLPHSILILYGENIGKCIPYIDNAVDSVEDVCKYCSTHDLRILHRRNHSFIGMIEFLRVYRLTKKYSVRGIWKDIPDYFSK